MPRRQHNTAQKSALSLELKSWLDGVIVPALVREYLNELESKNLACSKEEVVAECFATRTAIAERGK